MDNTFSQISHFSIIFALILNKLQDQIGIIIFPSHIQIIGNIKFILFNAHYFSGALLLQYFGAINFNTK